MQEARLSVVRLPWWLGLAGLLPFLLTLAGSWLAPGFAQVLAIRAFLFYSAVILSFLGGVHWGVAILAPEPTSGSARRRLVASMVPSLVAWPALLIDAVVGAWMLVAGFVAVRLYEASRDGAADLPDWYGRLRTWLTLVVVACHLLMIWRLAQLA